MAEQIISQKWHVETVALSYVIAVTGSFCTIQIMEQWRMQESTVKKRRHLLCAAIALGGCGIWAMHFTGMHALQLQLPSGSTIDMQFELGMTILSLLFPILGVFVGLTIASRDPFFLEIELERRKAIVADQIKTMPITELLKKGNVQRRIKFIALFSRPARILLGGLWAALGVLGMHYLGMIAQRSALKMKFDAAIVAVSCLVAFVSATAAFWIIFRALTFWPCIDALRIGSALVMGIAVCGTHYTGMAAARYSMDPTDHGHADDSGFVVDGDGAFRVASNGSLMLCFWLVSLTVVRDLRITAVSARGTSQPSAQTGNRSSGRHADPYSGPPLPAGSTPRNAVQPAVMNGPDVASLGAQNNNTAVARLRQKQQKAVASESRAAASRHTDFEPALGIVPGPIQV